MQSDLRRGLQPEECSPHHENLSPESVQGEVQLILTLSDREDKGYFHSYKKNAVAAHSATHGTKPVN
jgi:hypothetical protein